MSEGLAASFAARFQLPLTIVEEYTSHIAEQCALVANRYEPAGAFTLGAEIGAAIINEFRAPEVEPRHKRR